MNIQNTETIGKERGGRTEGISFSLLFPLFRQSALGLRLAMLKCVLWLALEKVGEVGFIPILLLSLAHSSISSVTASARMTAPYASVEPEVAKTDV